MQLFGLFCLFVGQISAMPTDELESRLRVWDKQMEDLSRRISKSLADTMMQERQFQARLDAEEARLDEARLDARLEAEQIFSN